MPHAQKIATCCYCGTRAALVLSGRERHELACSNCGAPLHELKHLRSDARGDRELVPPSKVRKGKRDDRKHRASKSDKGKYRKKKRSWLRDLADDLFDDVLDDVLDIFD